jgi:hypothetical protein
VTGDEVRRQVLEAVERGELPPGGPSELAARDLTADAPAGYWRRYSAEACARIRADRPRCSCADGGDGGDRCRRCWGWRT